MKYPTEKEPLKQIDKKIVSLRKHAGISQTDLCYEINIDISTLSRLVRGILNVTFNTLFKIARYFKIDVKELFNLGVKNHKKRGNPFEMPFLNFNDLKLLS